MKKNLDTYWYESQVKNHITQFLAIFSDLKVSIGKGLNSEDGDLIDVNIIYGSRDRVVSHILSANTQNKPVRLPILAGYLSNIELAPDLRKGTNTEYRTVEMPRGGDIRTDLRTYQERMAVPYRLRFEVAIYTSNKEHMLQILEQLLMLFTPDLQIQTSDQRLDYSRLTTVELDGITNSENYPSGTSDRVLAYELSFNTPIYLRPPKNIINNVIKRIYVKLDAISREFNSLEEKVNDMATDGQPYTKIIDVDELDLPEN